MFKSISLFILTVCTLSVYAESVFYSSALNLLFLPEVKINGQMYIKGVLKLDDNGQYTVNSLTQLDTEQKVLLDKTKSIPCGPADTLGRLAAYRSFIDGSNSYCLVKLTTTVEGGIILRYLFIENGQVQTITDTRDDAFAGCCLFLRSTQYNDVQFGYLEADVLVEQNKLADINFERDYLLKINGDGTNNSSYY